jgi:phytoene synthase
MLQSDKMLSAGFQKAREITKQYAKTFYFASHFLDKEKRDASYALYALCRISDESVDGSSNEAGLQKLDQLQKLIDEVYSQCPLNDSLLYAFRSTVNKYGIPKLYFEELILGMRMDLQKSRYQNFSELYQYCYKVAGVIGLMILKIFGYSQKKAEDYAVSLGIAMQLTNILRDIKEDFSRGRIYLPQVDMREYGINERDLDKTTVSDAFKELMQFQIKRARQYYSESEKGIRMIEDGRARFVALAMKEMYAGILGAIEKNNFDVLTRRAHVTTLGKIAILFKVIRKEY